MYSVDFLNWDESSMYVILFFIHFAVFFGYKLYKSVREKERKRDEKKKLRQQKKKK
jgi:predicted membrane protein